MRTLTPKKNGPAKTPTETLKQRGSWRAKEREKTEPQVDPGIPEAPKELKGRAKREWKRICEDLSECGILSRIDGRSLVRYCKGWAEWLAMADFDDSKIEIKSVEDLAIVGRYYDKMIKLSEHLLKFEVQYGMTPASRPNVKRLDKPAHGNSKDKTRFIQAVK